ncbi:uncharacterized protein Eint_071780 [Encephalitozoon intestinalis ATCC 50506]|uniref:Uncharacterized protein n=1 Tax=Encephalitozoon intestinalis (strain ATCC 50506) TaxID=876142 RepID=E0S8A2_ENCIT|nr:uncharacterized protein Eint_071780 [Encephalitozoon intestinalis ATCC 50506]ADM11937.1 hypothetical protein Eint_071780 [Encephalitozoon intestinalis ATCC 50506]UTX45696.1 DUF1686 domain-containing protein [Encephalitozoon intestinalis]
MSALDTGKMESYLKWKKDQVQLYDDILKENQEKIEVFLNNYREYLRHKKEKRTSSVVREAFGVVESFQDVNSSYNRFLSLLKDHWKFWKDIFRHLRNNDDGNWLSEVTGNEERISPTSDIETFLDTPVSQDLLFDPQKLEELFSGEESQVLEPIQSAIEFLNQIQHYDKDTTEIREYAQSIIRTDIYRVFVLKYLLRESPVPEFSLESSQQDALVSEILESDYFLFFCLLVCSGLIALQSIFRKTSTSKETMNALGKISYAVSILGPILHGMWILSNENYSEGIIKVISSNWNVIASMAPMFLVLRDIKYIKNGELMTSEGATAIGGHGVIVAMSMIMMCAQTLGKKHEGEYSRQTMVFMAGNIIMTTMYGAKLFGPWTKSRNHFIILGYIVFALILFLMVMMSEKKKIKNRTNDKTEWMGVLQWIIICTFLILGLQKPEFHCLQYAKNEIIVS